MCHNVCKEGEYVRNYLLLGGGTQEPVIQIGQCPDTLKTPLMAGSNQIGTYMIGRQTLKSVFALGWWGNVNRCCIHLSVLWLQGMDYSAFGKYLDPRVDSIIVKWKKLGLALFLELAVWSNCEESTELQKSSAEMGRHVRWTIISEILHQSGLYDRLARQKPLQRKRNITGT